jgi:hypothetical protein
MRAPLALVVATALAACQPVRPVESRPRHEIVLETEEGRPLPWLAGELLTPLMRLHADDLALMRDAIECGDHEGTAAAARSLLAEPRLSRPVEGMPDTVNEALPGEFYDLQDRMLGAARAIERAATGHDDAGVTHAYQDLTATCTSCHAVYRATRARRGPTWRP